MDQRVKMSRVDDDHHCGKVLACRSLIHDQNYKVNGKAIDNLLQATSLVPNVVCSINVDFKMILTVVKY